MRITLIVIAALVVAAVTALYVLGLSPFSMAANLRLATGVGAKLACSGHHLTGLTKAQVRSDILSYSPALNLLDLQYGPDSVQASIGGLSATTAVHRPGLGCTLEIGDTAPLNELKRPSAPAPTAASWPAGTRVTTEARCSARLCRLQPKKVKKAKATARIGTPQRLPTRSRRSPSLG